MAREEYDIGIIGFGAVGLSFLFQLEEQFAQQTKRPAMTVAIFDPSPNLGVGYAYGVKNTALLLNTYLDGMGLSARDPLGFKTWLSHQAQYQDSVEEFLPRSVFAEYLQKNLQTLLQSSALNITVIQEEVTCCDPMLPSNSVQITTQSSCYLAKSAVFAHGGSFKPDSFQYLNTRHFVMDVYAKHFDARINTLDDHAKLLLLGANLTMVDACILLGQMHHTFSLTIASQSGYFPARKHTHIDPSFKRIADETFKEAITEGCTISADRLIALIDHALSKYYQRNISIASLSTKYRNTVEHASSSNLLDHQDSLDLSVVSIYLDDLINALWGQLDSQEKEKINPILNYLLRFICGIPEKNIAQLAKLSHSFFNVKKVHQITPLDEGFLVSFAPNVEEPVYYDALINCMGIGGYYHGANCRDLAQNIISKQNFLINHSFGLTVNPQAQVVSATSGQIFANLYAIGEASIGSYFTRSSFSFYVSQAASAAESLLAYLTEKKGEA